MSKYNVRECKNVVSSKSSTRQEVILAKTTFHLRKSTLFNDKTLAWDAQAEHVLVKSKKLLSAFKFLRKYLTETQFLKAALANYYSSIYFSSSVWYHSLKQTHLTKLNSYHYRLL